MLYVSNDIRKLLDVTKLLKGIKQDDADDWVEAAATMGDIYEKSWITIAATGSSNSRKGIYSAVSDRYKARALQDHDFHVREDLTSFGHGLESWPLLTRAWAYQERQLSPRMVHFGQEQIFWACNLNFKSQDGWYSSASFFNPHRKTSLSDWYGMVAAYSGLQLTYESDRLPAIAAIVQRVMRIRPHDTYIAGMWKDTLIPDLLWYVMSLQARPRSTYCIPTWSWASASGEIRNVVGDRPFQQLVQLLDVTFTPIGTPHIGQVEGARITLQGPTCRFPESAFPILRQSVAATGDTDINVPLTSGIRCTISRDFDWQVVEPPVGSDHDLIILFLCKCLRDPWNLQKWHYGMIIRAVEDEVFERVGFGHIYLDSDGDSHHSSEDISDKESSEVNDEEADVKNMAHEGAVYFFPARPGASFFPTRSEFEARTIEIQNAGMEHEINSDDMLSSFVRALPIQTFTII